jgi:hypothetical protein
MTDKELQEIKENIYAIDQRRQVRRSIDRLIAEVRRLNEQLTMVRNHSSSRFRRNKRYKQALEEIAKSEILEPQRLTKREQYIVELFSKLSEIAQKALKGETNE